MEYLECVLKFYIIIVNTFQIQVYILDGNMPVVVG